MSTETKSALDAAIAAHIADDCDGGVLTGYILMAQYQNIEMMDNQETGYYRQAAEGQSFTTSLGLTHYLAARMNAEVVNSV